ncbi:hypothetical protein PLESTB_000973300 [Pleodorina starrii]|uniref:Uncharacterized protein n=1 Tax=Pleodorina starrii TaxID=330485 RepID=A0A9W6BP04_9CHLO|nr:hypothetical protein PLESTM_001633200 [Pleodorina starrii]GLC55330.1 hypothetical protein PLESTB_000973300 [Pleodorina starrii]GLC76305.1 hypothetical protein PLESTF_001764600 [Pleodorina starrii]
MFLPPFQLESVLLRRLEQLQALPDAPALGMGHCFRKVLQVHASAAGLEWSSTDGHEEGLQENIQVDLSNAALSAQLDAWETWLAANGVLAKAQYLAATHALIKDVLNCITGGSDAAVSRAALDAAWVEDAGSGSELTIPADQFKNSLAALAISCSSDGTPETAAACLTRLLAKTQEQQQRWQDLLEQYGATGQPQHETGTVAVTMQATEAAGDAAVVAMPAAGDAATGDAADGDAGDGDAADGDVADGDAAVVAAQADGDASAPAAGGSDSGDLDTLLGKDDGEACDVARDSDKSPEAAETAAAGTAEGDGGGAAEAAEADDDDAFSLGLSRAASHTSSASNESSGAVGDAEGGAAAADDTAPMPRRAPAAGVSVKSIEDPELRRALSETSSADLDELPPDDLDAVLQRQGSHSKASTRHARKKAEAAAAASAAAAGGEAGGKGHLADLDLEAWAELKDKQQRQLPPAVSPPPRGRAAPGPAPPGPAPVLAPPGPAPVLAPPGPVLAPPGPRGDAGKQALDQHLKGARGLQAPTVPLAPVAPPPGGGNSMHYGVMAGSTVRQSIERRSLERGGGTGVGIVSRHGSNGSSDSPARIRTLAANLSRKLSISEPGPAGQQAEWKHLPALGQGARLHPHCEMRQPSHGTLRTGASASRGRGDAAAVALAEDKLPVLPALAGARGQPPKAMELLRKPSGVQRSDTHHAASSSTGAQQQSAPNARLPGLGPASKPSPQGARALIVQTKKSFRGDSNF